jgi:Zn-dependent peptidase ImmA (M78 family)/transcriptional regulator with XRE-family HTH domain
MFNPTRLALARKRRGMTKIALAKAADLAPRGVTAYETGEYPPSDEAVAALAEALRFPSAFFDGDDIEEPNPDGVSFRALTSMSAAQRDAALAAGTLAIQVSKWIVDHFELPHPDLPSLRGFLPDTAAQALRIEWGLGERPIHNIVHLLEAHGVRVFSLPIDTAGVDAFSVWHRDTPYIFLTTDKSGERGRFDAAHELGHLALHRHGGPRGREAEFEADRFASAFLMPQGSVLAQAPRTPTLRTLIRAKQNWAVSVAALVHRLRSLDLISEWHYRTLCIEMSQLGYRKNEPDGIPRENSQVLSKVFGALRDEGIPRGSIARELQIPPDDFESLVFGLVISAIPGGRRGNSRPKDSKLSPLRVV